MQDTVTQVIEQNMNGLDYLLYMSSTSDSSGQAQITLTFSADANPDIAQVQVQNKLQLATPLLPQEVQRQGISVAKRGANFLKVYAFVSEDGSMDNADIADYVATNLKDAISRISGVGEVSLFGSQYGMRIWLDPHKLQSYKLMPSDVINAINAQNAQVSAGQLGGTPSVPGPADEPRHFGAGALADPGAVRQRHPAHQPRRLAHPREGRARVELGSESYSTLSRYNGKPATGIAVKLATGANALETASNIDDYLKGAEAFFPQGLKAVYPFDTTPVVKISIHEVVKTLGEACFWCFWSCTCSSRLPRNPHPDHRGARRASRHVRRAVGVRLFHQHADHVRCGARHRPPRDDAIVVVENVERVMSEDKLSPKEAARKSMDQITGALVGIAWCCPPCSSPWPSSAGPWASSTGSSR